MTNHNLTLEIVALFIQGLKQTQIAGILTTSDSKINYHKNKALKFGWIKPGAPGFYEPGPQYEAIKDKIIYLKNLNDQGAPRFSTLEPLPGPDAPPRMHRTEFKTAIFGALGGLEKLKGRASWTYAPKCNNGVWMLIKKHIPIMGLDGSGAVGSAVVMWGPKKMTLRLFIPEILHYTDNYLAWARDQAEKMGRYMARTYGLKIDRDFILITEPEGAFPEPILGALEFSDTIYISLPGNIEAWVDRSQGKPETEIRDREYMRTRERKYYQIEENRQNLAKLSHHISQQTEAMDRQTTAILKAIEGLNKSIEQLAGAMEPPGPMDALKRQGNN